MPTGPARLGRGSSKVGSPHSFAKLAATLLIALVALLCDRAGATVFYPATFQGPDGAITLTQGGDYVEPYFATKALIVAQDGGLDIHEAAQSWINWALPRQRPDGLFRRFCRANSNAKHADYAWRDCAPADADDSMLALWMQLLYRMAPSTGLPVEWQRSIALAAKQLAKLRNGRLGVYHISRLNHVALFMDNIEVYAALKDVARGQLRLHDPAAAATDACAVKLDAAIQRIFWDRRTGRFRPSMQKSRPAFYPDIVAQVYPWLADVSGPGQDPRQAWQQWRQTFGAGWIERRYDTNPWGLVALAAEKLGDTKSATCWTARSDSLRGSGSWNVLEEAAWQSLRARFPQAQVLDPGACDEIWSAQESPTANAAPGIQVQP
ncbi:MAG: hypothetical protein WBX02_18855 [Terriglobales bacterium]